jgi:hypothetical protein
MKIATPSYNIIRRNMQQKIYIGIAKDPEECYNKSTGRSPGRKEKRKWKK